MALADKLNGLMQRFSKNRAPKDLVAVDFDPRGIACVRVKRTSDDTAVVAADVLPGLDLSGRTESASDAIEKGVFRLPATLSARHVAICVPGDDAVIKLLSFPGELNEEAKSQIATLMGIEESAYRISYKELTRPHGRSQETKLLTLAFPEKIARAALDLFPVGIPAPVAVEVSALSAITAFLNVPERLAHEAGTGVIELGFRSTFLAFFSKDQLVLIRKFDFGIHHILDVVRQNLGVDMNTAVDIMHDGSFDISLMVKEVLESFVKQLVISKHFVERRESMRIERVFVSSGLPSAWMSEVSLALALDLEVWDPFEGLSVLDGALTDEKRKESALFAASVGSAIGVFEKILNP